MLSLEPSIKRGLTFWDRALLPADEFDERVRIVRAEMKRAGLSALIIAGDMYEDEDLVFLVGYNVDGVCVLPLEGEPAIFTNSGSREGFFLRELTWIADLSHRGALVGATVAETLRARGVTAGRVGTLGFRTLSAARHRDLIARLSDYALDDFTEPYRALRAALRPREMMAARIALGMAETAVAAAERAFATGASNASAVIEAERAARRAGAWDVRILANIESDALRPFERPSDDRREQLLLWVATRYQGYWADKSAGEGTSQNEATSAVAAMMAATRPGARARDVAAAGLVALSALSRESAEAYGLGTGVGVALNAAPLISLRSDDLIQEGTHISFRVFARGEQAASFTSALIHVGRDGAQALTSLPRNR